VDLVGDARRSASMASVTAALDPAVISSTVVIMRRYRLIERR
jgi:hypothetical protein